MGWPTTCLPLDSFQISDELYYYIKQTLKYRVSTILDVKLYSGSSDNIDHISVKNDIPIQHSTQKGSAGHSLNNVPNSSNLVLF